MASSGRNRNRWQLVVMAGAERIALLSRTLASSASLTCCPSTSSKLFRSVLCEVLRFPQGSHRRPGIAGGGHPFGARCGLGLCLHPQRYLHGAPPIRQWLLSRHLRLGHAKWRPGRPRGGLRRGHYGFSMIFIYFHGFQWIFVDPRMILDDF